MTTVSADAHTASKVTTAICVLRLELTLTGESGHEKNDREDADQDHQRLARIPTALPGIFLLIGFWHPCTPRCSTRLKVI